MHMRQDRCERRHLRADPPTKKCPERLSDVPTAARCCAFCAQPVGARLEPTLARRTALDSTGETTRRSQ